MNPFVYGYGYHSSQSDTSYLSFGCMIVVKHYPNISDILVIG